MAMPWQDMLNNPVFLNSLMRLMSTAVQVSGRGVMGPAQTDVITPMRAVTNRESERGGGGVDDDEKPGDGGARKAER